MVWFLIFARFWMAAERRRLTGSSCYLLSLLPMTAKASIWFRLAEVLGCTKFAVVLLRRFMRMSRQGAFKFEVRQLGRGCLPNISVPTQAPSSCGVRVCIETEMSFPLQIVAY